MAKGGSRPRTGPAPDPNSGRSERRRAAAKKTAAAPVEESCEDSSAITSAEFDPTRLSARGRTGNPPAYPLPKVLRFVFEMTESGKPAKVASTSASDSFRKRELEIWRAQWRKPQALAWEREPYRWDRIALYCRITVIVELEPDSNASLLSRQREIANEQGLTPDGLKSNGWAIAADELAVKRAAKKAPASGAASSRPAPVRRLQPPG